MRRVKALTILLAVFLVLYLVLNVAGQTRSEVGRLWLFLVPLIMVFITPVIKDIFTSTKRGVYFIIALQFISTFIMFIYQDFY